jgi:hypothetical protein
MSAMTLQRERASVRSGMPQEEMGLPPSPSEKGTTGHLRVGVAGLRGRRRSISRSVPSASRKDGPAVIGETHTSAKRGAPTARRGWQGLSNSGSSACCVAHHNSLHPFARRRNPQERAGGLLVLVTTGAPRPTTATRLPQRQREQRSQTHKSHLCGPPHDPSRLAKISTALGATDSRVISTVMALVLRL